MATLGLTLSGLMGLISRAFGASASYNFDGSGILHAGGSSVFDSAAARKNRRHAFQHRYHRYPRRYDERAYDCISEGGLKSPPKYADVSGPQAVVPDFWDVLFAQVRSWYDRQPKILQTHSSGALRAHGTVVLNQEKLPASVFTCLPEVINAKSAVDSLCTVNRVWAMSLPSRKELQTVYDPMLRSMLLEDDEEFVLIVDDWQYNTV